MVSHRLQVEYKFDGFDPTTTTVRWIMKEVNNETDKDKIEYLTNQNDFLKRSNKKLVEKNKLLEEEFDRLLEENNNFRLVRNEGKVL